MAQVRVCSTCTQSCKLLYSTISSVLWNGKWTRFGVNRSQCTDTALGFLSPSTVLHPGASENAWQHGIHGSFCSCSCFLVVGCQKKKKKKKNFFLSLKLFNYLHCIFQTVNMFNMFVTYGDTFLPNPNSYDELYYELIRMHQVFDNLYSMGEFSRSSGRVWCPVEATFSEKEMHLRLCLASWLHKKKKKKKKDKKGLGLSILFFRCLKLCGTRRVMVSGRSLPSGWRTPWWTSGLLSTTSHPRSTNGLQPTTCLHSQKSRYRTYSSPDLDLCEQNNDVRCFWRKWSSWVKGRA